MGPDPAFSMMRIEEEEVSTNRRARPRMSQLSCEGALYLFYLCSFFVVVVVVVHALLCTLLRKLLN